MTDICYDPETCAHCGPQIETVTVICNRKLVKVKVFECDKFGRCSGEKIQRTKKIRPPVTRCQRCTKYERVEL